MEFYEPQGVRLNAMRRFDPDSQYEVEQSGPELDRFGFVGDHKQASETTLPVEILRQREQKWIEMLNHWDKWISKRSKKVKERCRKGIPPSVRGRAWQQLSGSNIKAKENQGLFDVSDQLAERRPSTSSSAARASSNDGNMEEDGPRIDLVTSSSGRQRRQVSYLF